MIDTCKQHATLGVVVVTFNSADVIRDCLETLLASAGEVSLRVVIVDNNSTDSTVEGLEAWAAGEDGYALPADLPFSATQFPKPVRRADHFEEKATLHIIQNSTNGGFAAGVNAGLAYLASDSSISRFWVLNPDCVVPPGTPEAFAKYDPGRFSIMGGRVTYYDQPEIVQVDGGKLKRWTGMTENYNFNASFSETSPPPSDRIDYVTGACMVASREFYESAGPLTEDYFLYYEELDWAQRRGALPLAVCGAARVYHRAGTSIGSPAYGRPASSFSLYFKHRARMRFVRKHLPRSLPFAWMYTILKVAQFWLKGWRLEAKATFSGASDNAPPEGML